MTKLIVAFRYFLTYLKIIFPSVKGARVTECSQLKGVKPKMRERKLRNGVSFKWGVKAKRRKTNTYETRGGLLRIACY
jgi:hypothetical protein